MRVEQENDVAPRAASQSGPSGRRSRHWWVAVLAFAAVVALVVSGILPRIQARNTLAKETKEMAIPTVAVVRPQRSAPSNEIVLPANVQAYIDSPIYARTNGYLKQWYADIGARVTSGELLAEIETPEVDQQLRQARADLRTAEANLNLAQITADRYVGLLKT
ncbi:MAG: biotin/lipoyl-binding protein, partial [Terriglobales bacterium]